LDPNDKSSALDINIGFVDIKLLISCVAELVSENVAIY
jgi:hypothetical protein